MIEFKGNDNNNYIGTINNKELKGLLFEHEIKEQLNKEININKKILTNVCIYDFNTDKDTEIDLILITYGGVYVIESKNWDGYIVGKLSDKKWTQKFYKKVKGNTYPNPIRQNEYHIDFLSKYLSRDKSIFKSYIVFPSNANINRVSEFNKSNVKVLKIDDLINTIINDLKCDNSMILTYEEMDQMYIKLDNIDINEIELKKE